MRIKMGSHSVNFAFVLLPLNTSSVPVPLSASVPARFEYLYFAFIVRQREQSKCSDAQTRIRTLNGTRDTVPMPIPIPSPIPMPGSSHKFNALIDCVRRWATTATTTRNTTAILVEDIEGIEKERGESIAAKGELHSNRGQWQCKLLAPRVADNSRWLFA